MSTIIYVIWILSKMIFIFNTKYPSAILKNYRSSLYIINSVTYYTTLYVSRCTRLMYDTTSTKLLLFSSLLLITTKILIERGKKWSRHTHTQINRSTTMSYRIINNVFISLKALSNSLGRPYWNMQLNVTYIKTYDYNATSAKYAF